MNYVKVKFRKIIEQIVLSKISNHIWLCVFRPGKMERDVETKFRVCVFSITGHAESSKSSENYLCLSE